MVRHRDAKSLGCTHAVVCHYQRLLPEFFECSVRWLSILILKPFSLTAIAFDGLPDALNWANLCQVSLWKLRKHDLSLLFSLLLGLYLRCVCVSQLWSPTVTLLAGEFGRLAVLRVRPLIQGTRWSPQCLIWQFLLRFYDSLFCKRKLFRISVRVDHARLLVLLSHESYPLRDALARRIGPNRLRLAHAFPIDLCHLYLTYCHFYK